MNYAVLTSLAGLFVLRQGFGVADSTMPLHMDPLKPTTSWVWDLWVSGMLRPKPLTLHLLPSAMCQVKIEDVENYEEVLQEVETQLRTSGHFIAGSGVHSGSGDGGGLSRVVCHFRI